MIFLSLDFLVTKVEFSVKFRVGSIFFTFLKMEPFNSCVVLNSNIKHGCFKSKREMCRVSELNDVLSVGNMKIVESDLIASRLGRSISKSEFMCPNHRERLGVLWKPPTGCCHPSKCAMKGNRAINEQQYAKMTKKFGKYSVPVGGLLCIMHRTSDLLEHGRDTAEVEAASTLKSQLCSVRGIFKIENGLGQLQNKVIFLYMYYVFIKRVVNV